MLFLIDINQVMLISDADADFDWSLDALRLVQNQLILIDHGTTAAPKVRKSYQRNIDSGIEKGFDKIRNPPIPPLPNIPNHNSLLSNYVFLNVKVECFEDYGSFLV